MTSSGIRYLSGESFSKISISADICDIITNTNSMPGCRTEIDLDELEHKLTDFVYALLADYDKFIKDITNHAS